MRSYLDDTIAAVSTPVGAGGIAIIRISGPDSLSIAKKLFSRKSFPSHKIQYGKIIWQGNVLDECLLTYMKPPKTYTCEEVVEINCHGGIRCVQRVLEAVYACGGRPAEPGEFTKRAFLNGRMDLSQAEAVMDIINAKTSESLTASLNILGGSFSGKIKDIRDDLLLLLAQIEVSIDYPEHDIDYLLIEDIKNKTFEILKVIESLYRTADTGKIIKEGIDTVILGRPNVGKSSLMNLLLDEERAIVTDIAGTTRDVLQEYINIDGIPLKISDTAGIRETDDAIEKIGVSKTMSYVEKAELLLLLLDASSSLTQDDIDLLKMAEGRKAVLLLNKSDLENKIRLEDVCKYFSEKEYIIQISAKKGSGMDKLYESIKNMFFNGEIDLNLIVTNARHKNSLLASAKSLENVLEAIEGGLTEDLFSLDLKEAYEYLGEITGETLRDDIIDKIFSTFCLGK